MRCPHCKQEGTAFYISGSGTASKLYGCRGCKKQFRTVITRPVPPLRWEEVREIQPDVDGDQT
jgi:transposase-like protein